MVGSKESESLANQNLRFLIRDGIRRYFGIAELTFSPRCSYCNPIPRFEQSRLGDCVVNLRFEYVEETILADLLASLWALDHSFRLRAKGAGTRGHFGKRERGRALRWVSGHRAVYGGGARASIWTALKPGSSAKLGGSHVKPCDSICLVILGWALDLGRLPVDGSKRGGLQRDVSSEQGGLSPLYALDTFIQCCAQWRSAQSSPRLTLWGVQRKGFEMVGEIDPLDSPSCFFYPSLIYK